MDPMAAAKPKIAAPATAPVSIDETAAKSTARNFVRLPSAMARDATLSAEAIRLAAVLMSYDFGKGYVFPKISTLENDTGTKKRTVIRSLEELERYGFLTRKKRGRNNGYFLAPRYIEPPKPDAVTTAGGLLVENAPIAAPVRARRHTLQKPLPPPELPLAKVPVGAPIPIGRAKAKRGKVPAGAPIQDFDATKSAATGARRGTNQDADNDEQVPVGAPTQVPAGAPISANRCPQGHSDLEVDQVIKYTQQQVDAAAGERPPNDGLAAELVGAGIREADAVAWARELEDLPPADVIAALAIMLGRNAYRTGEVTNPVGYLRRLVANAVPQQRDLAEHYGRMERAAEILRFEAELEARDRARRVRLNSGESVDDDDEPVETAEPISADLAARAIRPPVNDTVRPAPVGDPGADACPEWWPPIAIALRERLGPERTASCGLVGTMRAHERDGARFVAASRFAQTVLTRELNAAFAEILEMHGCVISD
jgi:hypothetical protein